MNLRYEYMCIELESVKQEIKKVPKQDCNNKNQRKKKKILLMIYRTTSVRETIN
jgi:hypothetical protein